jgi:hypothetical protein
MQYFKLANIDIDKCTQRDMDIQRTTAHHSDCGRWPTLCWMSVNVGWVLPRPPLPPPGLARAQQTRSAECDAHTHTHTYKPQLRDAHTRSACAWIACTCDVILEACRGNMYIMTQQGKFLMNINRFSMGIKMHVKLTPLDLPKARRSCQKTMEL